MGVRLDRSRRDTECIGSLRFAEAGEVTHGNNFSLAARERLERNTKSGPRRRGLLDVDRLRPVRFGSLPPYHVDCEVDGDPKYPPVEVSERGDVFPVGVCASERLGCDVFSRTAVAQDAISRPERARKEDAKRFLEPLIPLRHMSPFIDFPLQVVL